MKRNWIIVLVIVVTTLVACAALSDATEREAQEKVCLKPLEKPYAIIYGEYVAPDNTGDGANKHYMSYWTVVQSLTGGYDGTTLVEVYDADNWNRLEYARTNLKESGELQANTPQEAVDEMLNILNSAELNIEFSWLNVMYF